MQTVKPADLEKAMPALVEKLKQLQSTLSLEEQVVFGEIIQSAAKHTLAVQSHDEGSQAGAVFSKPMSVHATSAMKRDFLSLPKILGVADQ